MAQPDENLADLLEDERASGIRPLPSRIAAPSVPPGSASELSQSGHRSVAVAGCCVGDAAFHEEHAAGQRARFDAEYSRLTPFCKQEHDVANRKRSKITLEYVHASVSADIPGS